MCLGAACFAGVLLGCFALTYLWKAKLFNGNYAAFDDDVSTYLKWLFILVIVGLVILTLNAILNVLKKRSGHFIFGMLLVIWLFITVCILGLLWRNMRKK